MMSVHRFLFSATRLQLLAAAVLALAGMPALAQEAAPPAPEALLPLEETPAAAPAAEEGGVNDLLNQIGADSAAAPNTVRAQPPVDPAAVPPENQLAAPAAADPAVPAAQPPVTAEVNLFNVPVIPPMSAEGEPDPNLFFDADSLVPEGEMGTKGGPRKVNPVTEPASALIVVTKDYDPGSRQAQLVSAQRAVMLGRYDSALAMYDVLYEKNKRDPNVLMGRAVALQHTGQEGAAIHAYQELLDLKPNNLDAEVNMLGLMGKTYPAVAERRLLDLREKNPNNVTIVAQLAIVEAQLGRNDEAVRFLGMAAGMEPRNAAHLFNMAVIADRAGDKQNAVKYYEQALETDAIYGGSRSIPRDAIFDRLARLR